MVLLQRDALSASSCRAPASKLPSQDTRFSVYKVKWQYCYTNVWPCTRRCALPYMPLLRKQIRLKKGQKGHGHTCTYVCTKVFVSYMPCGAACFRNALCNEEVHDLYSSLNVTMVIKQSRIRWTLHAACMWEMKNSFKILVGNLNGRDRLGNLDVYEKISVLILNS
jgi:hypothetical protein